MEQVAYSFAITLLHSVWQMALLLLLYALLTTLIKQWTPLAKRNLLFRILAAQVLCTILSFYLVYNAPFSDFRENIQELLTALSSSQSWLYAYAETFMLVYTLVVLYKLGTSFIQWASFRRHYKTMLTKPSIDVRLFTQTKAYHFGIKQKVAVWYSENIHSPMTFGFLKPVILLPVALVNQLTLEQTESLIVHELTHIKQHDFLRNWFLVTAEAVYFFNPFVKIIANKIRLEREKNCDLQVLHFDYPAIGYAETLLHTAQQQRSSYSLQLSAVKNKSELLHRISFFTSAPGFENREQVKFPFALAAISLLLVVNLAFAGYFLRNNNMPLPDRIAGGIFAAMPANEWNKSFSGEPFINNETAPAAKPRLQKFKKSVAGLAAKKSPLNSHGTFLDEEGPVAYEETLATPVSFSDETAPTKHEIIIKEEISSGKIITRFYQLKTVNGEMILEPLWMTAELAPSLSDSSKLRIKADSNHVFKLIPTIQ